MQNRGVVCGVFMLLALAAPGCEQAPPAEAVVRPVHAMRLTGSVAQEGRRFPGQARAVQEVDLSFRVDGDLIEFPVDVGDQVEAGQMVARLDPRDFGGNITELEASVALAAANLAAAEDDLQRTQRAFDSAAATEFELTATREARNAAAAQVAAAEARLGGARDALNYATLRAPYAGNVTAEYVDNFQHITAGQPILRILDDSRIEMVVYVPEHLMSAGPTSMEVRCQFEAFPDLVLEAELKEVGTEADPVTRTYPITVIMDQPEGARILPGMTGHAWSAQAPPGTDAGAGFIVPLSALAEGADGARFVWLIGEDGAVSRRDVEVGALVLGGVRIKGVAEGEVIATAGAAFLAAGQRVKPVLAAPGGGA
ncbi:MAG: efflux RND transporter periplasmic adaptor subunit [Phycisphaerales bacterium JB039]